MVRSILAVIAGFVAATAVMMVIETVNGRVLYPELGKLAEGMTDREAIRALLAPPSARSWWFSSAGCWEVLWADSLPHG